MKTSICSSGERFCVFNILQDKRIDNYNFARCQRRRASVKLKEGFQGRVKKPEANTHIGISGLLLNSTELLPVLWTVKFLRLYRANALPFAILKVEILQFVKFACGSSQLINNE